MPALTEARRRRPDTRFFWVVEEAFAPLLRLHPAVQGVIPVASRRWPAFEVEGKKLCSMSRASPVIN
jgi:ADP-heptose:LPS heptosyltransferase